MSLPTQLDLTVGANVESALVIHTEGLLSKQQKQIEKTKDRIERLKAVVETLKQQLENAHRQCEKSRSDQDLGEQKTLERFKKQNDAVEEEIKYYQKQFSIVCDRNRKFDQFLLLAKKVGIEVEIPKAKVPQKY